MKILKWAFIMLFSFSLFGFCQAQDWANLKRFQKECSLYTFVGRKGSELLVELLSAGAPLVFP